MVECRRHFGREHLDGAKFRRFGLQTQARVAHMVPMECTTSRLVDTLERERKKLERIANAATKELGQLTSQSIFENLCALRSLNPCEQNLVKITAYRRCLTPIKSYVKRFLLQEWRKIGRVAE